MKKSYLSPVTEPVELYPADGVLNNASNEGYSVETVDDPFGSSVMGLF